MAPKDHPQTPDGRYFLSRGKLWRMTDPALPDDLRRAAIKRMMRARLEVRRAEDAAAQQEARARVDAAKVALGERGPVWWDDGAPDETGAAPEASSYAAWWAGLDAGTKTKG
ncbi:MULTISPECIES: hypothetical protein [Roseobacteraceae]|jgi:hypothetical protein|uniref:Uncharacterized protein n=1 Tax=Pseudosulfitobacter pseudonitzschiae TaxID=1402135 RepID=A0A221JYP4_9RHOB|nr:MULTISPECIES: hypothetical protein [Roseobacteraceae]ASM71854.1 hypothetical protein SULPSESMR1_01028 [Pseudosulfitobacter pseudonitzschiae]